MADLASQYMISNPEDCQSISTSVATRESQKLEIWKANMGTDMLAGIETGSLKFANFISYLGEYIADEDLIIQAKCNCALLPSPLLC